MPRVEISSVCAQQNLELRITQFQFQFQLSDMSCPEASTKYDTVIKQCRTIVIFQYNLKFYVPYIILQYVYKPTRCTEVL